MADKFNVRSIPDSARLKLVALPPPGGAVPRHGSKHAQCLAWVLMSKTMGEYRAKRRDAGDSVNGGYIGYFIRKGAIKVDWKR